MKLITIIGARPQIIKAAALSRAIRNHYSDTIQEIIVHTGHVIPLDGILEQGEVMLNQASLTGESVPAAKRPGAAVYAGSVVEEGSCIVRVTGGAGENRYDRIVRMIEESERLNSGVENRAYDLADRLVPWRQSADLGADREYHPRHFCTDGGLFLRAEAFYAPQCTFSHARSRKP